MIKTYTDIIFDFGGVILNLDEYKTFSQLAFYFECAPEDVMPILIERAQFLDYECGKITSNVFISLVQHVSKKEISREKFISIWNAMLLDFPLVHIDLLKTLRTHFTIHLLSNTNELHIHAFRKNMSKQGIIESLEDLFDTVWYSSSIGMRKPYPETYTTILKNYNIEPSCTLFLDDKVENVEGAQKAGVDSQLVTAENTILQIFKEYNLNCRQI
ncbi:MAG: HAD-IA family hydrolase [Bacteroidales bacterium]|jgi:FMN phosphatase YigB (HAD superfamily)|nr:HAD-IA family hydrolase [Bacteroidales bacterium]